jgi:hypothetical protein
MLIYPYVLDSRLRSGLSLSNTGLSNRGLSDRSHLARTYGRDASPSDGCRLGPLPGFAAWVGCPAGPWIPANLAKLFLRGQTLVEWNLWEPDDYSGT